MDIDDDIRLSVFFSEPCAVMPPLEIFMEVSYEERRAMLYRDLERGDVVIGRINNIREYGFFLTLLCTAVGLKRDIEDLELSVGQTRLNVTNVAAPCDGLYPPCIRSHIFFLLPPGSVSH